MPDDPLKPADDRPEQVERQLLARTLRTKSVTFPDQLRIPQFGIIHLLAWMTITAIMLQTYLAIWGRSFFGDPTPLFYWMTKISLIIGSILASSELVAAAVLVRARCYRMLGRLQPGHWLVVIGSVDVVLGVSLWVVVRLAFGHEWMRGGEKMTMTWVAGTALASLALATLFGLATIRLRDARRWKFYLGMRTLGEVSAATFYCLTVGPKLLGHAPLWTLTGVLRLGRTYWTSAMFLLLLAVVIVDLPRRSSRDWVHWLGVFCVSFSAVLTIVYQIIIAFFPPGR